MTPLKIVAVNGSPTASSRTGLLVDSIVHAMQARWPLVAVQRVDVQPLAPALGRVFESPQRPPEVAAAIAAIEDADILVAASPIYRGAYTGLFKHLFDLIDQDALAGTPVLLAATGGSERHTLALDHVFRPLFSFFRANTVPTAVYAAPADFEPQPLALKPAVVERIAVAVGNLDWVYTVASRAPA